MKKINLQIYKKALMLTIVIVLIAVDFLLFHDFFSGQGYTFVEYLILVLNILIILLFRIFLMKNKR